jgi:hypothetical protein
MTFWGGSVGSVARVAAWRGPRRANVLLQEAYAALKGLTSPQKGHDVLLLLD